MTVVAQRPDAAAFAPFGAFIGSPDAPGTRRFYSPWIAPVAALAPQFHTNCVPPSALPLAVTRVERHPHASQVFLPLRVSRYLVTVLPSQADGRPDVERAHAFLIPGTVGVVYRPDVWHAGIVALDTEASFAVLMWRGAADDDVFADVAPFIVSTQEPSSEGGPRG